MRHQISGVHLLRSPRSSESNVSACEAIVAIGFAALPPSRSSWKEGSAEGVMPCFWEQDMSSTEGGCTSASWVRGQDDARSNEAIHEARQQCQHGHTFSMTGSDSV